MKLSTKIFLPIILISALLILLNGCFLAPSEEQPAEEQPAVTLYTVTYDGNENTGGEVPVDATLYKEGDLVTVLGNTGPKPLVNTGYGFYGWNTAADASGTARPVGYVFAMGTSDVTLYAQWDVSPAYAPTPEPEPVYGPTTATVYYDLTMAEDPPIGGSATDVTGTSPYAANTVVIISAAVTEGYEFVNWTAPAGTFGDENVEVTTFTMPAQDVTVTANFVKKTYTITVTAGDGGSITPSGPVTVDWGTNKTFTITPNTPFYEIADVLVDATSKGKISSYTFSNVTEDHTISATFELLGPVYNQNIPRHYVTIGEAMVDPDADPGDTILVMAGTYPEKVTIDVEGLTIRGENLGAIVDGGFILKADNITIDGLTIKNGFSDRGIFTRSATGATWGSKGHQIINNEIFDVKYAVNIVACGTESVNIVVDNNKIHDCRIAIMLEGYETIITNNEFYDNIKSGIEVERSCDNVISYNSIYNNGEFGIRFGKVETNGNVVNYNNIYWNVTFGVLNASEASFPIPVDSKDNWWGDASGPSGMGPGTGDAISVKVNYIPWSTSPY